MILSRDAKGGGTVILTPTKTGTRSAESALTASGLFVVEMPRHGKTVPEEYRQGTVIVTVRHPHARLVSAYFYGRKSANNPPSWFYGKADGGFVRFVRAWVEARKNQKRKHHDWTATQSEYVSAAVETNGGVRVSVHRLEDGGTGGLIDKLRKRYPNLTADAKHVNRSMPEGKTWEEFWTAPLLEEVGPYLDVDLALGGYARPTPAVHGRK